MAGSGEEVPSGSTGRPRSDERRRAAEILDLHEGRIPRGVALLDDQAVAALLRTARRIAIVGASPNPIRPSNGVMRYLLEHGYDVVPVNPLVGEVLGRTCHPTVGAAALMGGPFDIVDVFRRPEFVLAHVEQAIACESRAIWLQLGIVDWEAARRASAAGLAVVMDRCTAIEHRRLLRSERPG